MPIPTKLPLTAAFAALASIVVIGEGAVIFTREDTGDRFQPQPDALPAEAVELPEQAGVPVIAAIEAAGPGAYSCSRPAHDPATPSHAGELFCANGAGGGYYLDAEQEAGAGEPLEGRKVEVRDGKVWVEP